MKLFPVITLVIVSFALLAVYRGENGNDRLYTENKKMIVLRKIMHELMRSAGDSTSQIQPVKKISEQEFRVYIKSTLAVVPDSFVNIVREVIKRDKLEEVFTANIVKCGDKQIAYAFASSPISNDNIVPCLGRKLPEDCYYLDFIFAQQEDNSARYFYPGAVAVVSVLLFFFFAARGNKKKKASLPEPVADPVMNDFVPLGRYKFNPAQQWLELDGEKTTLTQKENQLLSILTAAPGTIIERATLQKEIWENEGVIVTRSLDMFISKLRKKLGGDPALKIINIHGKGYKFEVSV
ncbi:MAG: winged helix-turn-helix domain-containing protein [Ferruginibacter sp.]